MADKQKFDKKIGIIQSRGLGDIIIALPIADHYHKQGYQVVWPICEEFYSSFKDSVPWVDWRPITTDPRGDFFLETPLQIFREEGIGEDDQLYLYQYLSSMPELTDPELFSILKFDQYKYWVSGVPFMRKWEIRSLIKRNLAREQALRMKLKIDPKDRICVTHLQGSTFRAAVDLDWLDPAVRVIEVDQHLTESIWDWLGILELAEAFVGVDSAMSNLVDSWGFDDLQLYWIRRSAWDLTPVLGRPWVIVPTSLEIPRDFRVDPAALALEKQRQRENPAPRQPEYEGYDQRQERARMGDLIAHVPFAAKNPGPTSYLSAVKKPS